MGQGTTTSVCTHGSVPVDLVCVADNGLHTCEQGLLVQVTPDLKTNAMKLACYKGTPLATAKGPCTVSSVVGGTIK